MLIRQEIPADRSAIHSVETAAFQSRAVPGTSPAEPKLVDELRTDGDLVGPLSLVALRDDAVVGHVCCSRARIDGTAAEVVGLGPIGVLPEEQGAGVGSALMHAVVSAADALGVELIGLLGDPKFYSRFGFVPSTEHGIDPPNPDWAKYFQVRPLTAHDPLATGTFHYAPAFDRL